jgi:transcriptional regulator with XRE-family HTH domain
MEFGELLAEARQRAGLTLRALAAASGTSAATLHAYEHGAKEPSLVVARRIARAAGFGLDVELAVGDPQRPPTTDELFKLELDRLIAERLIADPALVLGIARRNLARARLERPTHEQGWIHEWDDIIEGPLLDLVSLLLATDANAIHLKQMSPFAGTLSQDERVDAMARARGRRGRLARAS